jgi:type I restriction-modification system DNA methylase subunit
MSRPERQQSVLDILKRFRGLEPLKELFWSELNYQRVNQPISRHGWTEIGSKSLAEDPVLFAGGGQDNAFHVIYARLASDRLLLGLERPVVSRLLRDHPYALFVFSSKAQERWHFLNVKYDEDTQKRRVFRRITVDSEDDRLRTASESIAQLDLAFISPELLAIPPLDIQEKHDKAFDKEPLTKDFFKRFEVALEAIKSDLEKFQEFRSAEAYTQAQLLLERLIFLYFLQNRGWLNQDRHYLHDRLTDHLSKPQAFTYYSEFLDKLFWTLSSAPGEGGRLPGVPFLNGGLFDDDEFRQPAGSRKTNPPLKVRNSTFNSVFGDLLEAFNFTVTEDTPLNQEVAVDPEMLGKVFESIVLHAEAADPDATAPDKRKATGSYYTPRIVVHFICREVLYQYLHARWETVASISDRRFDESRRSETAATLRTLLDMDASDGLDDEAKERLKHTITPAQAVQLRDLVLPLKCCDPAVGSGAFPVGLLHELVNLRRLLTTAANGYVDPVRGEGSTWLHDTKADIVQNCLFGVDIQQQAIEICRLRLWLTMVVDYDLGLEPFTAEKSQFSTAINKISQLPNLEMNFHRGDSLHDHICGVPIVILPDRASRHADAFRAIYKLGERFHKAKTGETKRKLRLEILEKRLALSARILEDELKAVKTDDSKLDNFFGLDEPAAEKRKRFAHEAEKLTEALKEVEENRDELERLMRREFDSQFFPKLRKLEGADFDSPFNFAWTIDFPGVFAGGSNGGGFDIVVGNPPFVTARNPKKREMWRERWPRVCSGTYQLVAPFFELGFSVTRKDGELGFIVSNAFAKREFGKPLVENFLPTVELQKIVDCSGLLFPGHGTPTCLVFARNSSPPKTTVRCVSILPGGGDLRTAPEESPLWLAIVNHHAVRNEAYELSRREADQGFRTVYEDFRITVGDCFRERILKHPCVWSFTEWPVFDQVTAASAKRVDDLLSQSVGRIFATSADDIFFLLPSVVRRIGLRNEDFTPLAEGDEIRNWQMSADRFAVRPYDGDWVPREPPRNSPIGKWLWAFRKVLGSRKSFQGGTYDQDGVPWFAWHQLDSDKVRTPALLAFSEIATHNHFVFQNRPCLFTQTSPVLKLASADHKSYHLFAACLNSSLPLLWLKQICYNKGAGQDEERDRFVYGGGKVEQLPIPRVVAESLQGKPNSLAERLTELSKACWERGQQMPSLSLRKLFEKPGEAYHEWNSSLPGHVPPNPELGAPFQTEGDLRGAYLRTQTTRERLRAQMIALQEEMDWLVYAAYGLLPQEHPAVAAVSDRRKEFGDQRSPLQPAEMPAPLDQAQRPFRLWQQVDGNYAKAVALIPATWPAERRALWEARLAAIRDNEHIRRIEQPVYKRRWDEQWKVGNEWRSGPVAYAAEFVDAFEWWLSEKAEWWLEHKKNGGPVELDDWAEAIWKDSRVQAAWPVAAENYALLEYEKAKAKAEANGEPVPARPAGRSVARQGLVGAGLVPALGQGTHEGCPYAFLKTFKRIIDDESVPEDIPFAVPYDELENRKMKISPKVKSIRGKLNVPRERFHLRGRSEYLWAGLQFRE